MTRRANSTTSCQELILYLEPLQPLLNHVTLMLQALPYKYTCTPRWRDIT